MLPQPYFERITRIHSVRTDGRGDERRQKIRLPIVGQATFHPVVSGKLGARSTVRVRDISTTGIGVLLPISTQVPGLIALGLSPKDQLEHWLLCRVSRVHDLNTLHRLVGATFEMVLEPHQPVMIGAKLESMKWVDVTGESEPTDPYQILEKTSPKPGWKAA